MKIINCKYIFNEDEINQIITWYLEPQSLSWIANKFGIKNRNVIKNILLEHNIDLHSSQVIKYLNTINNKKTCLEKYNVENTFQVEAFKNKAKQTKLERYEDENYHNSEQIISTCLQKYGTANGGCAPEALEKIKATNLKHWGQEYYFGCTDYKIKTKATNLKKYGVDHIAKMPLFQHLIEQTMLNRYGVRRYAQTVDFHFKSQHKYKYNNETFDSFPELATYVYCIDHNISVKRAPVNLIYYYNSIQHYYIPDFSINDQLIEIKGNQFLKEDGTWQCPFDHSQDDKFEAKHQCALANGVHIWYQVDYQKYIDYFNKKYKKEDYII